MWPRAIWPEFRGARSCQFTKLLGVVFGEMMRAVVTSCQTPPRKPKSSANGGLLSQIRFSTWPTAGARNVKISAFSIFRNDDYDGIGAMIHKLLRDNISDGGVILTVDNGYIGPFHQLRRYRGTGGKSWSYLARDKLAASLAGLDVTMKGFGYLNVASASLQFGRHCEFLNTLVYYLDKAIFFLFRPSERAVTIIRAPLPASASLA